MKKSLTQEIITLVRAADIVASLNVIPGVQRMDFGPIAENVFTNMDVDVDTSNSPWWNKQQWNILRADTLATIVRLGDPVDNLTFSITRLNNDVRLGFEYVSDGVSVAKSDRKYFKSENHGPHRIWVVCEEKGKVALSLPIRKFRVDVIL